MCLSDKAPAYSCLIPLMTKDLTKSCIWDTGLTFLKALLCILSVEQPETDMQNWTKT